MLLKRRLRGQTLIELLIASAVIAGGLFSAVALIFSNLRLSDRDSDSVVAINLAREGIEQARELRDSNWLAGNSFDAGMCTAGGDYSAIPNWDGKAASDQVSFDFTADDFSDESVQVKSSTEAENQGFLTQNTGVAANPTPWKRLITFHPICDAPGGLTYKNDGETCAGDPTVGVRVESRVRWQRKGQSFERVLYDDLFDWR